MGNGLMTLARARARRSSSKAMRAASPGTKSLRDDSLDGMP